jgi:Ni/Fe-hydrogenase subunit HybB-like protein
MIILLKPKWRENPALRILAFVLVVGGLIAFRWDVNLSGQLIVMPYLSSAPTTLYTSYTPSFIEIVVAAGVIAFGMTAITLGVKYFRIVDHGVTKQAVTESILQQHSLATGD